MLVAVLGVLGVFALLVIIQAIVGNKRPVRGAVTSVAAGLFALLAVDAAGVLTGVSIPISPLSLGVSGAAGIPGVTLLLLLNLIIR